MENKTKKNDVILIAAVLVIALGAYGGIRFYQAKTTKEPVAVVTIGEREYGRFSLNRDIVEKIELPDGSYNVLEIRDGKADVTEASCPDGICVNHRAVSKQNETIVCLPNELVVKIENGESAELDAVTN